MKILGVSGALDHDPSAALLIDGQLIAAAEEERFTRDKHAKRQMPEASVSFCLKQAQISPQDVDAIAIPFAPISLSSPARWHYAKRMWYAPERALDALFNGNRRYKRYYKKVSESLTKLGFDLKKTPIIPVEHHLAHASSAYHLSGFKGKCAVLGIDGKGEYATTFFGYAEHGVIHKIKEFYDPDSLGGLYGAMTQYLGFEMLDGEFKVMGMAPYGDANHFKLDKLLHRTPGKFEINTNLVNTIGLRRYKENGTGFYFSPKLVEWLGPMRQGDEIDFPYIHYAAALQKLLEDTTLHLIDYYLGDIIKETGQLCFAGGVALNVKLNQRILDLPQVKRLFIQPAASDAGTAIGAASFVTAQKGIKVSPLQHVYLGPSFTPQECLKACEPFADDIFCEAVSDPVPVAAELLSAGNPVAWFQGRMEFGPRALGNRSILGCPSHQGVADKINAQIKYRERWRPFCPSILDTIAEDILQTDHPAPYMTITFDVNPEWKERIPEVVHEDGTARAQVVTEATNPRYYALLNAMEEKTGNGVLLNTSLNRRGEPMVCSPEDALNMFLGCDLEYLFLENILVQKRKK